MGKGLSALIAVACLCIIGATVFWGVQQYRAAHQGAYEYQPLGDGSGLADLCDDVLVAAERRDFGPAQAKANTGTPEELVNSCRTLVEKRKARSNPASPAE